MNFTIFLIVTLQLALIFVKSSIIHNKFKPLSRNKRWAYSNRTLLWPTNVIYYKIVCPSYTPQEIALIKSSFEELMNKTCLIITEINSTSNQVDYANIRCDVGEGCKARVGYKGGPQLINLEKKSNLTQGCLTKRVIQHEFLHCLGFKHEHTSPSRDDYLELLYDNMKPGYDYYFAKDSYDDFSSYGPEFCENCVMMPPAYKHSKNGLPTMIPKNTSYTADTIGKATGVSDCDITRINNIYCAQC